MLNTSELRPQTSDLKAMLLLALLVLATSLPFVRRAYFVDDFYFVTMARGILQHPWRPYDFVSDDAGLGNIAWERGRPPRMVNPPLFHYFLAGVIALWGDSVWKLRAAALIFPLGSVLFAYFLGKRFVRNALAAASLMAVTPAFWLTSYSLLIDGPLLTFFLATLWCFMAGEDRQQTSLQILSGFLMGLTLLTKYTGFLILPVILCWHWSYRGQFSWKAPLVSLGTCALLFLAWGVWGLLTYGQMHFFATLPRGFHAASFQGLACLGLVLIGGYLRQKRQDLPGRILWHRVCWGSALFLIARGLWLSASVSDWLQTFYLDKSIVVASFLGGGAAFLLAAPWLLWIRDKKAFAALGLVAGTLYLCFVSRVGGFDQIQSAMLAFFIGSTGAFLVLSAFEWPLFPSARGGFLGAWLLIGFLELIVVMPWTAGRYLLLVLPPLCWFFRSLFEKTGLGETWWRWVWCGTALLGVALAYADYAQAGVIAPLSKVLSDNQARLERIARRPPNHWYYLADTFDGSQPYILRLGWQNVFPYQKFHSGDLFLRSRYRKSAWWKMTDPERFHPVAAWEFNSWIPLRVMDVPASAGFYASCWGSLPFVITRHPLERFELYQVK